MALNYLRSMLHVLTDEIYDVMDCGSVCLSSEGWFHFLKQQRPALDLTPSRLQNVLIDPQGVRRGAPGISFFAAHNSLSRNSWMTPSGELRSDSS